ncbi:MAG: glycosyltransferase [Magnetococcales bacterium]|nr:glycosyltransferase [Magnetococcales bacterium]
MNNISSSPKVTVLLPFRNASITLEECFSSIQVQSLPDFELLAVDDGSDDGSDELVKAYGKGDGRIRLLSPGRVGLVEALNLGIKAARTPFIARMDADDRMHPERLELQWRYLLDNPNIDLVSCRVSLFPEEIIKGGFREYIRWQNECLTPADLADEIYWESPVAHPSVMFRKQVIVELGSYRDGDFPEDYELWLRMVAAGKKMSKLKEILVDWREGENRLSRQDPRYSREAFDRLRGAYLARDPRLHDGRELVIWGSGRVTRKRVRHLLSYGFKVSAWVDVSPRKIGHMILDAPVVSPEWLMRKKRPLVLSYVVKHGARDDIKGTLEEMGYERGRDYLMVG